MDLMLAMVVMLVMAKTLVMAVVTKMTDMVLAVEPTVVLGITTI